MALPREETLEGLRHARGALLNIPRRSRSIRLLLQMTEQVIDKVLNTFPPINSEEFQLVMSQRVIAAIKAYKSRTGLGLMASKGRIDQVPRGESARAKEAR